MCIRDSDITFVGIIQTARASGLEKFPIPYVLTNCHNSLCAVGGTINEDDHMFGLTCAKKYGGVYVPPHQSVIHQFAREMLAGGGKMILGSDSHTRYGAPVSYTHLIARHEALCTLDDLLRESAKVLKMKGRFYMVHRPFRLPEIFTKMCNYGIEPKRMRLVHPYADKEPNMVLIEGLKGGKPRLAVDPVSYTHLKMGENTRMPKDTGIVKNTRMPENAGRAEGDNLPDESVNQKKQEPKQEFPGSMDSLLWAMYKTEPLQVEDDRKVKKTAISQKPGKTEKIEKTIESEETKAQDEANRNQRIREILEEFMA